jgi:FlaA1/EpsC-like NDP-sugar epimerase
MGGGAVGLVELLRRRVGGQAVFDFVSWFVAVHVAGALRFDFDFARVPSPSFLALGLCAGVLGFVVGKITQIYRGRFPTGSLDELIWLSFTALGVAAPVGLVTILVGNLWAIPRSTLLIATPLFLISAAGSRVFRRLKAKRGERKRSGEKVLIYGAGQLAETLVPQLLDDPTSNLIPVGLLDDDPRKANRWISGVKMFGSIENLATAAKQSGAQKLIVAIPQATAEILSRTRALAQPLGLDVYVMPTFSEILENPAGSFQLEQLGIEDLVGRRAVRIESREIREMLFEKAVLITGAGGSIGLELCKQVARYRPRSLIFLDRDETGLHLAKLEVQGLGLKIKTILALADIRDVPALKGVFENHKPQVVLHAAALKHLPILEDYPHEAWKTNVIGTRNVLEVALEFNVETFVNISTDKAADPASVLGRSKLLAEEMTAWASTESDGNYVSVRFGNVLGSRGSLVPTLRYLIENNLPITLTHPEATRFFMSISEACQLVLQAGTFKDPQAVLVLDMGEAVKILDIANRMLEISGKKLGLEFTGLRPGEKLHEVLYQAGKVLEQTHHESIFRVVSETLDPSGLNRRLGWLRGQRG